MLQLFKGRKDYKNKFENVDENKMGKKGVLSPKLEIDTKVRKSSRKFAQNAI